MISQMTTGYAFQTELDLTYEQALEAAVAALKEEGFGVLTEIDVKSTLKQKINVEFRKYSILGACNPVLANQALNQDLQVGLLLPCNVIVYERVDGGSVVAIADPQAMLAIADIGELEDVAAQAREKLARVINALSD